MSRSNPRRLVYGGSRLAALSVALQIIMLYGTATGGRCGYYLYHHVSVLCLVAPNCLCALGRIRHPDVERVCDRRRSRGGGKVPSQGLIRSCSSLGALSPSAQKSTFHHSALSASEDDQSQPVRENGIPCAIQRCFRNTILPKAYPGTHLENGRLVLLVGVSGGCDSVGLLHGIMQTLKPDNEPDGGNSDTLTGWKFSDEFSPWLSVHVHVVHFDHQQRGKESDLDRSFVETICHDYGLPLTCHFWNDSVSDWHGSTFSQDTARRWRRSKMEEQLGSLLGRKDGQCGMIVTAHHRDDSNETMLLKLLRGVHVTNLSGMQVLTRPSVSSLKDDVNIWYARPLLGVSKRDIVEFLEHSGWAWRNDQSNNSDKYLRNRVRNELIPLLTDLVGSSEIMQRRFDNLSQQSQEIATDLSVRAREFVDDTQDKSNSFFLLPQNAKFDSMVHKQALYSWISQQTNGSRFSFDQLDRVVSQCLYHPDNRQWRLNIGKGWNVVRDGAILRISLDRDIETSSNDKDVSLDWTVVAGEMSSSSTISFTLNVPEAWISEGSIEVLQTIVARHNLPIIPEWKSKDSKPVKLRQFLRGQDIPSHARSQVPVVCIQRIQNGLTSVKLAAVYVSTKAQWIVHKPFAEQLSGTLTIAITVK
jgi:tRNA(Ile)-lysidine synthetase-like protein